MIKLISKEGDFLPIMHKTEGRNVSYVEKNHKMFKNIGNTVDSVLSLDIRPQDLVIFDMVGAGKDAEILKKKGYKVIGGGELNDRLELERDYGNRVMEEHGIRTPDAVAFTDFNRAKQHVSSKGHRFVFKPNGNLDTALTYVSESADDMLRMLGWFEKRVPEGTEFELQEFIDGVEMSTEGWFDGTRFLHPFNSTMEEKKLLDGGLGPSTGCMGNVVWFWDDRHSQILYKHLFEPLEPLLKKARYVGPLDINAIWTSRGPYGLEWTARFGYDAIQAAHRLFTEDFDVFLNDLAAGRIESLPVSRGRLSISVRVSIPPFPNPATEEEPIEDFPIGQFPREYADNIYPSDVWLDDGVVKCAGTDGYICAVASAGKTLKSARQRVYDICEELAIPNKQYRQDIGSRYESEISRVTDIIDRMES